MEYDEYKNYSRFYTFLTCISFITVGFFSGLLFVGLFSANWDYIKKTPVETTLVLILGLTIPVATIIGIISLIKSIIEKEHYWYLSILAILFGLIFGSVYYVDIMKDIFELLLYQFK